MQMKLRCLFLVFLSGLCSGCGSVVGRLNPHGFQTFAGVRCDASVISDGWSADGSGDVWWRAAACLDMPWSLCLDLILLPLDLLLFGAVT